MIKFWLLAPTTVRKSLFSGNLLEVETFFHCFREKVISCVVFGLLTLFRLGGGGGVGKCPRRFQLSRTSLIFKQYQLNEDFYWNLLENKILEKYCVKGIPCYHGNRVLDTMFTQMWTF